MNTLSHAAQKLMHESSAAYATEYARRELLLATAEEGSFNTDNPATSPQKVNGQLLYIARLKVQQQVRLHEFSLSIPSADTDPDTQTTIKEGFEAALELSGFHHAFHASTGTMLGLGDAFLSFGASSDYLSRRRGFPCTYRSVPVARLYFPPSATDLRNCGTDRTARTCVRVTALPRSEALTHFPWIPASCTGRIPLNAPQSQVRDAPPDTLPEDDVIEIAEYFDLDRADGTLAFFAGRTMEAGPVLTGLDYPFRSRLSEPYLPLIHRKCLATSYGILNRGIFHLGYKLAMLERILRNMGYGYQIKNLDPVKIVTIPGMKESEFRLRHQDAVAAQSELADGIVFTPQGGAITPLRTESILAEMTTCVEQLREDFMLWGINLKDVFTDPTKTAYAIQAEGAAQTNFIRFIQRQNSQEIKMGIEMLIDFLIRFVPDTNPLPLPVIQKDGTALTLGALAALLRAHPTRILIERESGVVNPQVYERSLSDRLINRLSHFGLSEPLLDAIESDARLDGKRINLTALRQRARTESPTAPTA